MGQFRITDECGNRLALMATECDAFQYGITSTPTLFKLRRKRCVARLGQGQRGADLDRCHWLLCATATAEHEGDTQKTSS
jgi:hypothetical protein